MRIAFVCSAHGFGHVTRELVLADAVARRGAAPTVFSAAPPSLFAGSPHPVVPWTADVGIVQHDGLTEDLDATCAALERACTDDAIDALAERLAAFDRVVVDIAPPAMEACRRAGVRCVAVGNFDWAWIYRNYPRLTAWAGRFAAWQAPHRAYSLAPGPGLHGFRSVEAFGVVGRTAPAVRVADRSVLVCFGGFGLSRLDALLPRIDGITWILAPPMARLERPDVRWVDDVAFPALVAGADLLLTKPGYGIHAEAALAGTPMVWVDRGVFPEAPWLEQAMRARGDLKVGALTADAVAAAVRERLARGRPEPVASDAADALAERLLS